MAARILLAVEYLVQVLLTNRRHFGQMFSWIFGVASALYVLLIFVSYKAPKFPFQDLDSLAILCGFMGLYIWVDRIDPYLNMEARWYDLLQRLTHRKPKRQRRQPFYIAPRFEYRQPDSQGCIYLMRRKKDGIYKVGKTVNVSGRLPALFETYGELEPVAYWFVADVDGSEKQALAMTKQYFHAERRHRELRTMTERQAYQFVARFTDLLRGDA